MLGQIDKFVRHHLERAEAVNSGRIPYDRPDLLGMQRREERSYDEFVPELDEWRVEKTAAELALIRLTSARHNEIRVTVQNLDDRFLLDVVLRLVFDQSDVRGHLDVEPYLTPYPPRSYGSTKTYLISPPYEHHFYPSEPPGDTHCASDRSVVRVRLGDLRASDDLTVDAFYLSVPADPGTALSGTWEVTVHGKNGAITGRLALPVDSVPRQPDPLPEDMIRDF